MRKRLVVAAAVFAACLTPSVARAQRHSGAWISGGGGVGWATVHCDTNCEDEDANAALVLYIAGGIAVNEKLLLGSEFYSWSKTIETGTTERSLRFNGLLAAVCC